MRRLLLLVVVAAIFAATSVTFLAARAPRTWAARWSPPANLSRGAGQNEFAAVYRAGRWDLLWVDDIRQKLVLSRMVGGAGPSETTFLDRGDVVDPTMIRSGAVQMAAWIRNDNGRTSLMGALISGSIREFTIASGSPPIEHPYLFVGPRGTIGLVVSWQKTGNFDTYLMLFRPGSIRPEFVRRLVRAAVYSFYPRAVTDAAQHINLIHLENCCRGQFWNVVYDRFDAAGRQLSRSVYLDQILSFQTGRQIPSQWAEDLRVDARGNTWGAFAGDGGIWLFEANSQGRLIRKPYPVDDHEGIPGTASLVLGNSGGYLVWNQEYPLGAFIASRQFGPDGMPRGSMERVSYWGGLEVNPHAVLASGRLRIVWQSVTQGLMSDFLSTTRRSATTPTLAQRLGLGLGNPWGDVTILLIGAVMMAAIATTANILVVLALGFGGLCLMRLLGAARFRWAIYAVVLSGVLFLVFVMPGEPSVFLALVTMPSIGLSAVPFGLMAVLGSFCVVSLVGHGALRQVDDVFRIGIMAFLGVYFFAFAEAAVFMQQQLGYI